MSDNDKNDIVQDYAFLDVEAMALVPALKRRLDARGAPDPYMGPFTNEAIFAAHAEMLTRPRLWEHSLN